MGLEALGARLTWEEICEERFEQIPDASNRVIKHNRTFSPPGFTSRIADLAVHHLVCRGLVSPAPTHPMQPKQTLRLIFRRTFQH